MNYFGSLLCEKSKYTMFDVQKQTKLHEIFKLLQNTIFLSRYKIYWTYYLGIVPSLEDFFLERFTTANSCLRTTKFTYMFATQTDEGSTQNDNLSGVVMNLEFSKPCIIK